MKRERRIVNNSWRIVYKNSTKTMQKKSKLTKNIKRSRKPKLPKNMVRKLLLREKVRRMKLSHLLFRNSMRLNLLKSSTRKTLKLRYRTKSLTISTMIGSLLKRRTKPSSQSILLARKMLEHLHMLTTILYKLTKIISHLL